MNIVYFYENQISLIICRKAEPDILYLHGHQTYVRVFRYIFSNRDRLGFYAEIQNVLDTMPVTIRVSIGVNVGIRQES